MRSVFGEGERRPRPPDDGTPVDVCGTDMLTPGSRRGQRRGHAPCTAELLALQTHASRRSVPVPFLARRSLSCDRLSSRSSFQLPMSVELCDRVPRLSQRAPWWRRRALLLHSCAARPSWTHHVARGVAQVAVVCHGAALLRRSTSTVCSDQRRGAPLVADLWPSSSPLAPWSAPGPTATQSEEFKVQRVCGDCLSARVEASYTSACPLHAGPHGNTATSAPQSPPPSPLAQ